MSAMLWVVTLARFQRDETAVGCFKVKVRGEGEQWNFSTCSAGQPEQEGDILCSPSPSTFTYSSPSPLTFTLKQPSAVSARWTHAKITTHNLATTNITATANFYNQGFALILR